MLFDTAVPELVGVDLQAPSTHASSVHGRPSSQLTVHVTVLVELVVVVVVVPPDPPAVLDVLVEVPAPLPPAPTDVPVVLPPSPP
jgi:hypothetical protein